MSVTIRIDENIHQKLKLKSVETGTSLYDLANQCILDGLKQNKTPEKPTITMKEIEKLLEKNKKEERNETKFNFEDDNDFEIPEMLKLKEDTDKNEPH